MDERLKIIQKIGIVPVVVIEDVNDALPLAKALCAGGLPCAEITFRTAAAEEAIKKISGSLKEMLVGAGTVLNVEQARCAIEAGARFIVSPGFNPEVVKYCKERKITVVPGCSTPTEVEAAMRLGLDAVKFFPAQAAGGIKMIQAMAAPYQTIKFMPTGGVNELNLHEYLDLEPVIACGGTWMIDKKMLREKDFAGIQALTEKAVNNMLNLKLRCDRSDEKVVVMTKYMERAIYHLNLNGFQIEKDSIATDKEGKIISAKFTARMNEKPVYLKNEY